MTRTPSAFLVAACRYLAGKLLEASSLKGDVHASRALSASRVESGLDRGFHDTRHTVGPVVRQEILGRLPELNHVRYAAEVKAGLHDEPRKKRTTADRAAGHCPDGCSGFVMIPVRREATR